MFSVSGLKSHEDTSKTLRSHRVTKDTDDLSKIIEGVNNTMNPFTIDADDGLFCLTTGVRVKDTIRDDLINCKCKGKEWFDEFVTGCFEDPSRFEKPIKRRKILNFASGAVKSKITTKDLKVIELQGTRDLIGRRIFLVFREY